jgi:hypothetical protein
MELFPEERKRSESIRLALDTQFEFAERAYRVWLRTPKDKYLARSTLSGHVLDLSMLLNIQACRLFRAAIEQCERCDGFTGNILMRSLFQTVLALLFVLKRNVRIIVEPEFDRNGKPRPGRYRAKAPTKKNRGTRRDSLSRDFRADLYIAHGAFQPESLARKCAMAPGLLRASKSKGLKLGQSLVTAIHAAIGPEWLSIVRSSTYSGLSLAELAKLLDRGLYRWYSTVYSIQSGMAHAADAHRHAILDADGVVPNYFSTEREIRETIQGAVLMLLICMIIMQEQIGFGSSIQMQLDGFKSEFNQLFV